MKHLLLINGWSANRNFWIDLSYDLSAEFKVQIIDIDQSKTLDEWLALIDQNVSSQTVLMGWSLGGNLAIKYAATSKKEFLGLITLQTNPSFITRDHWSNALALTEFSALYDLVKDEDNKAIVRRFTYLLVQGSPAHKTDRKSLKACYSESTIKDRGVLLAGLDLLRDLDVRQALLDVSVPCLYLLGEQDALIPVGVEGDINALLLSSRFVKQNHQVKVLADMAHLPCWSHRPEILIQFKRFVKTL